MRRKKSRSRRRRKHIKRTSKKNSAIIDLGKKIGLGLAPILLTVSVLTLIKGARRQKGHTVEGPVAYTDCILDSRNIPMHG